MRFSFLFFFIIGVCFAVTNLLLGVSEYRNAMTVLGAIAGTGIGIMYAFSTKRAWMSIFGLWCGAVAIPIVHRFLWDSTEILEAELKWLTFGVFLSVGLVLFFGIVFVGARTFSAWRIAVRKRPKPIWCEILDSRREHMQPQFTGQYDGHQARATELMVPDWEEVTTQRRYT